MYNSIMKITPKTIGVIVALAIVISLVLILRNNPPQETIVSETPATETVVDGQEFVDNLKRGDSTYAFAEIELSYDHVVPGEYSEIYAAVSNIEPGESVTIRLEGGADPRGENSTQKVVADKNGVANFTFEVYQYGSYNAFVYTGDDPQGVTRQIYVE